MLEFAAILAAAYLIGGIPFGYLVARKRGVDILAQGSGNIGATNVGRVLGFRYGLLVFALDFAKGALPVAAARLIQLLLPIEPNSLLQEEWLTHGLVEVGAGLAAFLGHVLPIYLRFRGGKGVATGAGVVAVLVPVPALCAVGAWLLFTSSTRCISLASVVAAALLALVQLASTWGDLNEPRSWFCILAAVLVLIRHKSNLARLLKGTENRLPVSDKLERVARALHLLAVACWFGGSLFFTFIAAPRTFSTLERLTDLAEDRRPWFPANPDFASVDGVIDGPKEQASRLAGTIVGGMFPAYLLMQIVCGLIALVPALAWWHSLPTCKVHEWRCLLLLAGLLLALAGVWLEHEVHEARAPRNRLIDEYLKFHSLDDATLAEMKSARARFGIWHGISVLVNFGAIAMATGVLLLSVSLPEGRPAKEPPQPMGSTDAPA